MKLLLTLCLCLATVSFSSGYYLHPNYLYRYNGPLVLSPEKIQELEVEDNYIPKEEYPVDEAEEGYPVDEAEEGYPVDEAEEGYPVDEAEEEHILVRHKRQSSRDQAVDLALSHQDRNGNDRPVGSIHGRVNLNAVGQDRNNFHANGGVGVGSVLFRSNDGRHSLGAGVHANQHRGRFQGFSYRSRPSVGAGLGYRFRF